MEKRTHEQYLNLLRSEAQSHFRTQNRIYEQRKQGLPVLNRIRIFLSINILAWVYHYFTSRFGKKHAFKEYTDKVRGGVFNMYSPDSPDGSVIKMAVVADWATYTPECEEVAQLMKNEQSDYTIHLGDVYYVGAPEEVESNFTEAGAPWPRGGSGTLALPGNHEFYSNGNPYFDRLLPQMFVTEKEKKYSQEASFFCLENRHWRVIGLDTGYYSVGPFIIEWICKPDAHLDDKLTRWLSQVVKLDDEKDTRGIIFFSHHQYASAFEEQFTKPAEQLLKLMGSERKVIWIWGHEHRFAVYGKYQSSLGIPAFGRCIGHGGMPVQIGKEKGGEKLFTTPDDSRAKQSNLVFYDSREKLTIDRIILGYNGYAMFAFDQELLTIEYRDQTGWLFQEKWRINLQTGCLSGEAEHNPDISLNLFAPSWDCAVNDPQTK